MDGARDILSHECKNCTDQLTVTGQQDGGGGGSFINELRGPGQARNKVEEYKLIYPAGIFEYLFSPGTRYSGK